MGSNTSIDSSAINFMGLAASKLLNEFGTTGLLAQDLSYRLYSICEKTNGPKEAIQYNSLVTAWPEIRKLAMQEP